MKTILKFSLLIWLGLINNSRASSIIYSNFTSKWKEIENKNEIKIYERWVSFGDSIKVRERMGQVILDVPSEIILTKIINIEGWKTWMKNVNSSYLIKKTNDSAFYVYTLFNIPWPFNKRDMVSYIIVKTNSISKETTIEICSTNGIIPTKENVVRINGYKALWIITPLINNSVKLTFRALSTQPPAFPRWVMDPILRKMFHSNLVNLKQQIIKK